MTDVTDAHRAAFDAAAEDWFYPNLRDAIIAAVLGVDAPVIVNTQERLWPEAAVAEIKRLSAQVEKVRELHQLEKPRTLPGHYCTECAGGRYWPCPTIRAIEKENDDD